MNGRVARTYAEMTGEVLETESALLCALEQPSLGASRSAHLVAAPGGPRGLMQVEPHLSTVGISGQLSHRLSPEVRRCALGEMQRPGLQWAHDGMPNLLPMLRPLGAE